MKKITVLMITAFFVAVSAVAMAGVDMPSPLGKAADPPDGARVSIASYPGGATVTVSGLEVYKNLVYVYGSDSIETVALVNGSAKIPERRWINMAFKDANGLYHFLLVIDEHSVVPAKWYGNGVCVMPDFGKGSSLTSCDWLREEYKSR